MARRRSVQPREAIPILLALALTACACQKASSRADDDLTNAGPPAQEVAARVHLAGADGADHPVTVEVVRSEADLRRGLMYRKHLDPDAGMLFVMGEDEVHTFWMHNTYIPLDMLFITRDLTVAGVVADATPLTDDPRTVGKPSYYVLEVNGGWAKAHGVGDGARVTLENIRP